MQGDSHRSKTSNSNSKINTTIKAIEATKTRTMTAAAAVDTTAITTTASP